MQRYFVNWLIGVLAMVATSHMVYGRSMSILRAFEEAEDAQQVQLVDSNVDPANSLRNSEEEVGPRNSQKKKIPRKFVKIDLEGVHHGVTIEQGNSYALTCGVSSNPEAQVYWIRGENPTKQIEELFKASVPSELSGVDSDNLVRLESKYVIDCASKEDAGPIHCVAIAGENTDVQSTVITVTDSGKGSNSCPTNRPPVITSHVVTIFSNIGSTIVLPCRAQGMPRPETRWVDTRGNEIVNHRYNLRYKILETGDLMIENVEWSDMGDPTCIAESNVGPADRAETFLYPMKPEA